MLCGEIRRRVSDNLNIMAHWAPQAAGAPLRIAPDGMDEDEWKQLQAERNAGTDDLCDLLETARTRATLRMRIADATTRAARRREVAAKNEAILDCKDVVAYAQREKLAQAEAEVKRLEEVVDSEPAVRGHLQKLLLSSVWTSSLLLKPPDEIPRPPLRKSTSSKSAVPKPSRYATAGSADKRMDPLSAVQKQEAKAQQRADAATAAARELQTRLKAQEDALSDELRDEFAAIKEINSKLRQLKLEMIELQKCGADIASQQAYLNEMKKDLKQRLACDEMAALEKTQVEIDTQTQLASEAMREVESFRRMGERREEQIARERAAADATDAAKRATKESLLKRATKESLLAALQQRESGAEERASREWQAEIERLQGEVSTAIVGAQHALAEQLETHRGQLRQLQETAATSRATRIAELRSQLEALDKADEARKEAHGYSEVFDKLEKAKEQYDTAYDVYSETFNKYPMGHDKLTKAERAMVKCQDAMTALEGQLGAIKEEMRPSKEQYDLQLRSITAELVALGDRKQMESVVYYVVKKIDPAMGKAIGAHPDMVAVEQASKAMKDAASRHNAAIRELKAVEVAHGVLLKPDASPALQAAAKVHRSADAYDVLGTTRKDAHKNTFEVKKCHSDLRRTLVAGTRERTTAEERTLLLGAVKAVDAALTKLRTLESRRKYEIERIQDAVGPFAVLGLLRDATADDVKARRTELQQMLRPDQVTSEALTDATQRVNEAFETLDDAEKRAAYETEHPLQQRGRDAPGGGGDWELDRAMKRRHEETLQMLLDPLDTLLPPKGVNTTLTSKAKLSARVANHPAFKLACQLTVTQARIDFYEPTAKIEYGVHGELVPFSLDKDFRAATIVCTVAVGEWSLDITVPLELATCRNGGFCTPSLSTAVGQWMACSDVSSTLDELRAQIKAKWEDDRAAKEAMWNAKWPALAYKHPTSEPPVYLKSFEAWREDVGGGPSAGSDKRGREEPCENESPNSPARSPAKQARLM